MQGAKGTSNYIVASTTATTKLDYINVPIMANVYVVKGLAVKLGIQPGFKVSSTKKTDTSSLVGTGTGSRDIKAQSVDFSIPVGISYEYSNFQLDARYNWGLTNASFDSTKSRSATVNPPFSSALRDA